MTWNSSQPNLDPSPAASIPQASGKMQLSISALLLMGAISANVPEGVRGLYLTSHSADMTFQGMVKVLCQTWKKGRSKHKPNF